MIGNGYCDDDNNNKECKYDGGDCCGYCISTEFCTICECLLDEGSSDSKFQNWFFCHFSWCIWKVLLNDFLEKCKYFDFDHSSQYQKYNKVLHMAPTRWIRAMDLLAFYFFSMSI